MRACSQIPECSISYTKILQTSGKKACFRFPECSIFLYKDMKLIHHGIFF